MTTRRVVFGEAPIVEGVDPSFLSVVERARLESQSSPRRRSEFLAGRLAARRALGTLLGAEAIASVAIARDDDGAPRIEGIALEVSLSITHATSRALAVAAPGRAPLGVDLSEHRDAARIRRVARRAFPRENEREIALADDRAACIAWSAKEALAKAHRIGMLEGGGVERFEVLSIDPLRVTLDGEALAMDFDVEPVDEGFLVLVVAR